MEDTEYKKTAVDLVRRYAALKLGNCPIDKAKKCAIMAVNEIIQEIMPDPIYSSMETDRMFFWKCVKNEIDKL